MARPRRSHDDLLKILAKHLKKPRRLSKQRSEAELIAYARNHKAQSDARNLVADAQKYGLIPPVHTRTCVLCPQQAQEYHHPNGYLGPSALDVVPLCFDCHHTQHSKWAPPLPPLK